MNQAKIAKLKADRAKRERLLNEERHRQSIETNDSLKTSINNLYELINGQEPLDLEKLGGQIEQLNQVIDIRDQVNEIKEAIKLIKPEVHMDAVDLTPITEAIKQNKPANPDFSELQKAIIQIQQRVEEEPVSDSQDPEDYKPFRRVIKVGNKLVFDDTAGSGGSRGGGGGNAGPNVTVINTASNPVPVTGTISIDPTGLATSSNQDTELTRLGDVIETAPATDTASSGLNGRLQRIAQRLTSLIALLPGSLGQKARVASLAVTLSTEDISNLTPPAAITGFATASNQTDKSQFTKLTDGTDTALITASGEQNTLETNSGAIKTAVETIDNIVAGSGANISQLGGTNIDTNSGSKSAGTQRVVLATDQPQLTNALKVDGSAVTQPVSGTVSVTQGTSPWVTSNATTSVVGNGAAATAQRVTLANDSTGVIAAVTAITNALPAGTNDLGKVGTISAPVNTGQQTTNTTAVQISAVSTVPTNGILIGGLSTNTDPIFVGGSGVTTSNGVEVLPGASQPFTANLNTLYIRSASSTTDKIWYNVT